MSRVLVLSLVLGAFSTIAAENDNSRGPFRGNISQGDVTVGGSFRLDHNSRNSETSVDLGTGVGLFVVDRFAVGGIFDVSQDADGMVALMGPQAQFHFWNVDRLSFLTFVSVAFGLTDVTVQSRTTLGLGADYFITPAVAFGPYVSLAVIDSRARNYTRSAMGANFGIYL